MGILAEKGWQTSVFAFGTKFLTESVQAFASRANRLLNDGPSFPFKALLVLLVFNGLRPDRLVAGGAFLVYFPTVVLSILFVMWVAAPRKVLSNSQTKLFFLFLINMGIGAIFARNTGWALETFKSMVFFGFIYYLVIVQFVDTASKVRRYVQIYFLSNMFLILIGIANKGKVAIPVLADENEFALLCNTLIPMAFFLRREADSVVKRLFLSLAMAVLAAGTVMSFSRGGLLGLLAVGLFLYWHARQKVGLLLMAGLVACAAMFVVPAGDSSNSSLSNAQSVRHGAHRGELDLGKYLADMSTIFSEGASDGTGQERVVSWKAGWDMFLDHPVFGVGPKNYGAWLSDYYKPYGSKSSAVMWGRAAHSLYFTLLPETGLVGTIVFAMMLWSCVKDHRYIKLLERRKAITMNGVGLNSEQSERLLASIRGLHSLSLAYSGAMIGFLVSGAFISVLWYGYFWIFCSFWAMTRNAAKETEQLARSRMP